MDQDHRIDRDSLSGSARNIFEVIARTNGGPLLQRSAEQWEKFAQEDPYTYILTALKGNHRDEFWQSGNRTIREEFLPLLQSYQVRTGLCLELGCGIGRLLFPLARRFQQTVGVDIAQGMVRQAVSFAGAKGIENACFLCISGPEDFLQKAGNHVGNCDFIYSLLVFQHIPEFSAIEGYLHVIRVLLHKHGLAYLQFDTRPRDFRYRLKTRLPDFLLPRFWRRGIRRIRRSPEELEACIRRAGMEIVEELTPHTAYHRYILRLSKCPPGSK